MKTLILFFISLLSFNSTKAQNVGIGTNTPDPAAILDVYSTNKGMLPPRMTTLQRNAMPNKTAGLLIYNTSTACIEIFNGSNWINLCSSLPSSEITRTLLGGNQDDKAFYIQKTADGGYIIGGNSESSSDGDVSGTNHGQRDCWIVKLDAQGNIEWNKLLGGDGDEIFGSLQQTVDGGYIFCATSGSSANGDITGVNHGIFDTWVVKLNAAGGVVWNVLIGGTSAEFANAIRQTNDGGYILGAVSYSSVNGDVSGTNHGLSDYWVVKLTSTGTITWNVLLGGDSEDELHDIKQTADGGYIATGFTTTSANGDVTGVTLGLYDAWIVKLNNAGGIVWNRTIGGNNADYSYLVQQTADAGYIIAGNSNSTSGGNLSGFTKGIEDFFIAKLDASGNVTWTKLLGGSGEDRANAVQQTADGGYVIVGTSSSSASGDVSGTSKGLEDLWVVKVNSTGTILWQKLYGGSGSDFGTHIEKNADGSFIISGYTNSSASGAVIGTNHGGDDYWILKIDANGNIL